MDKFKEPELVFDVFMFKTKYYTSKKNKVKNLPFDLSFTSIIYLN